MNHIHNSTEKKKRQRSEFFPDEIVLGHLVIMRFSVHLCQRKFCNKHLRFPIHDLHVFVHPPLVSKSYAPCFCHVRTFPVSLYFTFRQILIDVYRHEKISIR
jgi:hypothetical protein